LALYGSIYTIPVYLGQIQGYDATQIGIVVMWIGLPQCCLSCDLHAAGSTRGAASSARSSTARQFHAPPHCAATPRRHLPASMLITRLAQPRGSASSSADAVAGVAAQ